MQSLDVGRVRRDNRAARIHSATAAGILCCIALVAAGCADDTGTTTLITTTTAAPAPALLIDSDAAVDPARNASRQRAAEVDMTVLLRNNGRARNLTEITLNLFPDTVYIGVITDVSEEGNGYTWTGHLAGLEPSSLTMVWTGSAFIAQASSPEGVFEISGTGTDGAFRVIEVDQGSMPGEF